MKAVKKIEISVLHKRTMPLVVYTMQGDTGREIECTVVDWDIPAGATARVWVVKPSKKVVYSDGKIMENSVVFSLTNQMLAEPGVAICIIEFASGDDVVSSFPFNLCIDGSARGDGIPSENESTVLEGMFEALGQDAIKALDEAKAEAAAANKSAQDTEKIKNDFTLTAQQAVADVNNAGQTQTQRVNTAGDTQVSRVQAEGSIQVQNVQAAAAEIAADREQIHTNRDNVAQLQRTTASAIIREAEGSWLTLDDAADGKGYRRVDVQGMTVQDGVPAPDAEVPLENVGALNPETGKYEVKVTATGAQLLSIYADHTTSWNGITFTTKSTGELTITGIATPAVSAYLRNGSISTTNYKDATILYLHGVYRLEGKLDGIILRLRNVENLSSDAITLNAGEAKAIYGKYICNVYVAPGVSVDGTIKPMLNAGSSPLPWEPYKVRTATVTSDRPLTQWDKLTCRDGVWGWAYGGATVVEDGSRSVDNYFYPILIFNALKKRIDGKAEVYCNYCTSKYIGASSSAGTNMCITNADTYWGVASAAEMKTWLAQKNAEGKPLYYQYKTVDEEWVPLTPQEQSAMNALCSYAGTTHIWTDDPLQPVISLEYTVDTETYIRETAPAYADIGKVAVTGEAAGEFVTCKDSAEWPLLDLELYGKTGQVKTTGAQLLRITASSKTQNGITFTVEGNGIIAIKGTATANANINLGNVTLQPGTYTLSGCPTGGNNTKYQLVLHGGKNIYDTGKTAAFSVADESTMTAAFYVYAGTTVNFSVKPMLNAGDTALPWEPYTGAAPSPSPEYPQELETTGSGGSVGIGINGAQLLDNQSYVVSRTKVVKNSLEEIKIENTDEYAGTLIRCIIFQIEKSRLKPGNIIFSADYVHTGDIENVGPFGVALYWGKGSTNAAKAVENIRVTSQSGNLEFSAQLLQEDIESEDYTFLAVWCYCQSKASKDTLYSSGLTLRHAMVYQDGNGTWAPYASQSLPIPTPGGLAGLQVSDGADYNYVDAEGNKWLCDVAGYEQDGQIGVLRNCIVWNPDTISLLNDTYVDTSLYQATKKELPALRGGSLYPGLCNRLQYRYNTSDTLHFYWDNNTSIPKIYVPKGYTPTPEDFTFLGALMTPIFEPYPPEIQRKIRQLHTYDSVTHIWTNENAGISARYVKNGNLVLATLEDRLTALEAGQAQTAAAFSYLPPETQAEMIENETRELMNSI